MDLLRIAARIAMNLPIKCLKAEIRDEKDAETEYEGTPVYPTIDGHFVFQLADGRIVDFDGRLDANDQNGVMKVDGVDVSDQLWADPDDSASLSFLGLDSDLDEALQQCAAFVGNRVK